MKSICLLILSMLLLPVLLVAAPKPPLPPPLPRAVEIPYQAGGPDWNKIPPLPGDFSLNRTPQPVLPTQLTEVRMVWNEQVLLVHFRCFEEKMQSLITYHSGEAIWQNDCVEFFIDASTERRNLLQIICSPDGQFHVNPHGLQLKQGNISLDAKTFPERWEAEITLPWSLFGFRPQVFRAALSRERRAGLTEYSTWNWPSGFNSVECHGYFFAGKQQEILREIRQNWLADKEYHQILARQQPETAKAWQNWLLEGQQLTRAPQETHSPAVVKWLDQLYLLQKLHPRQDIIYNSRIADLLGRP